MDSKRFSASFRGSKEHVEISVPIFLWNEDSIFYVYSPGLDLTGYGTTQEEAKESFEYILQEFVSYTHTKRTIFTELENLGWMVNKRKKKVISSPKLEDLLVRNEHFNDVYHNKDVKTASSTLNLAMA
jgi:hypothetical protein